MSAGLRLVVFDVDGTLIDSQHQIVAAMTRAFDALGLKPPASDAVLAIVGLSLLQAMARLAPGLDDATHAALVDAYRASFAGPHAPVPAFLYPGARAALERLAAQSDILLAVATGKSRRGLDHVLKAHDLKGVFDALHTADGHPSKPHPAMVEAALRDTGVAAGRAVMIGDTEFDIEMGRAAGVASIGVTWGYHPVARLRAAGADVLIDDFAALDGALQGIWGQ